VQFQFIHIIVCSGWKIFPKKNSKLTQKAYCVSNSSGFARREADLKKIPNRFLYNFLRPTKCLS